MVQKVPREFYIELTNEKKRLTEQFPYDSMERINIKLIEWFIQERDINPALQGIRVFVFVDCLKYGCEPQI
ncbi:MULTISPECIES: hypothetical protein [Bacillus]|uniref:hypothetical protein n=1 Tax=Bacillus TaxID=1386 RepID=UPI001CFC1EE0|nr:hypothetical protein [Bacillus subtilis]MCB4338940.1 hypothetical protein [Bacillus subtilis]MCY8636591.1 hypothetical protein [Bacillus sp. S17B2]